MFSSDSTAIRHGAARALLIAVPLTLLALLVSQVGDVDDDSPWVYVFLFLILGAFLAGGVEAGRRSDARPYTDGALAAFACYFVIQAVGTTRRLIVGDDVTWVALVFNALLAASAGSIGGAFGARRASAASVAAQDG